MELIPVVILGLMAVMLVSLVVLFVVAYIYDRRATRKVKDKASRYFNN